MCRVAARREQSGAAKALIDLSEAITTSSQQKIGPVSSVSGITGYLTETLTMASQVRRAAPRRRAAHFEWAIALRKGHFILQNVI